MARTEGAVERAAHDAAEDAAPWVERLARMGYAAKGVVYLLIGLIAVQAAWQGMGQGRGGDVQGSEGALETLLGSGVGRVVLGLIAVGMVGYALWNAVRAALDPEGHGGGAKRIAARAGRGITAVVHLGLAWTAFQLARKGHGDGGGESADDWTAMVMEQPMGRWIIAAVGVGIVGYGIVQLVRAWKEKVGERLDLSELNGTERQWALRLGRFGLAARGVVFGIIGWFLIQAALHANAGEARGLQGALRAVQEQGYGPWLLGAVGLGLTAYGLYEAVQARYRRIRPA